MQAEPEVRGSWVAEEERLAILQLSRVLDRPAEPGFDRWTAALRRETGAAVAALVLVDASCLVVKSLSTASGGAAEVSDVPMSTSLAEYLIGRTELPTSVAAPAYAEKQVVVDGQPLGWVAMADQPAREWSDDHRQALDDAAAAVSAELSLHLAHQAATRRASTPRPITGCTSSSPRQRR
jgi:hypothetical protein